MFSFFKKRYKIILIAALFSFLGFFAYSKFFAGTTPKKAETARVKRGTLEEKMTISGTVDAEEKTTLRFPTSGRLAWIGVKEGDYVKKYQTLASLDQQELKKKLAKYLNDYMTERWDYEQLRDDYKNQAMTDAMKRILDKAGFDMGNSVSDVEMQDLAIRFANLATPIEGIVTRVASPYAGVNITAVQAEIDVVNPKSVYFSALADQTEVTKIQEGKAGELVLDAYPDNILPGSIKNISFIPKSGETGTVYAVKFVFSDPSIPTYVGMSYPYKYRIGMAGDLTFIIQRKEDVLYLPTKFIKTQNGPSTALGMKKKYVNVKKNNQMEKVSVETGMETENNIEITKGLTEGTVVYD